MRRLYDALLMHVSLWYVYKVNHAMIVKMNTHAYIYLIREREFLLRNEPVFKIGRGAQEADRVINRLAKGYKKGSEIWLAIRCPIADYKEVECALKSVFRERFTKHGDGSEYFIGDPTEMTKLITEVVHKSWSEVTVNVAQEYPPDEHRSPEDQWLMNYIEKLEDDLKRKQAEFDKMQAEDQQALNRLHFVKSRLQAVRMTSSA